MIRVTPLTTKNDDRLRLPCLDNVVLEQGGENALEPFPLACLLCDLLLLVGVIFLGGGVVRDSRMPHRSQLKQFAYVATSTITFSWPRYRIGSHSDRQPVTHPFSSPHTKRVCGWGAGVQYLRTSLPTPCAAL